MTSFRIGVVGDLHTYWDEVDVGQFDRSNYDLLYFTGDLGGGSRGSSMRVARVMSRLRKQALVMPGNNDTGDIAELGAELAHRAGMKRLAAIRQGSDGGDTALDTGVRLCGYSNHRITRESVDVTVVAARPHTMGGQVLSFAEHMAATYGIDSMQTSTERLLGLVDATETTDLMFFSHNGPTGLGAEPDDMWG